VSEKAAVSIAVVIPTRNRADRLPALVESVLAQAGPQADQVIVVDDGKLVGAGTHESLLADCATYAEFADSQSVGAVRSSQVGGTP
jgi:ABC-type branched-subunit amino acid transport system ATPase component